MFGVPNCGVEGVDRVNNVRWVDNKGSFHARNTRFGGESGGIPIVFHQQPAETTSPHLGRAITFDTCWLYAGQSNRSDSGVIILDAQVPQLVSIRNCQGPSDVPYIINPSAFNITNYISNWAATTGRDPNIYFRIDIGPNSVGNVDGSIYVARIPAALRPYVVKGKSASLRRATAQSIPNGFTATDVIFDTVIQDGISTFNAATPSRIRLPAGCTKMMIHVNANMAVNGAAKTISITLRNGSGVKVAGECQLRGINTDSDRVSFSALVEGVAGEYWVVTVQHNAAAALDLNDCRVGVVPLDNI